MHVFSEHNGSSGFCQRSQTNSSQWWLKHLSALIVVYIALRMSLGVSMICGVMVMLSNSVCNACLSSPVNIILICFHSFFVWLGASTSTSRVSR